MSALAGNFADFKIIKTRSVLQIVVEIPIEQGQKALELLGIPQPGQEIPVAIARLVAPPKAIDPDKSSRAKEAYATKDNMQKAVVRAAMLCKEAKFQDYIAVASPEMAANWMRRHLGVEHRSEIASNEDAYENFLHLETDYRLATGQMAEVR